MINKINSLNSFNTFLECAPINTYIKQATEEYLEYQNRIKSALYDEDLGYEFDRLLKSHERLIKLSQISSYREGFISGIKLFVK